MSKIVVLLAFVLAVPTRGKPTHASKSARPATPARPAVATKPAPKSSKPTPATKRLAAKPGPSPSPKAAARPLPRSTTSPAAKPATKPAAASCGKPAAPPAPALVNEAPKPAAGDPDRERLERLQEALDGVVRGKILGRLRVGMRVENLASGRLLYGWRSNALMDPASNQKVLATTTALLRLGSTFRYRTEVTGPRPDPSGVVQGDLVVRGSGDPSLRSRHVDALAAALTSAGITRVTGAVLADPRRIGSEETTPGGRSPLRVGGTTIEIHVRPGERVGSRPLVSIRPASDAFVVTNQAETRGKGKPKLSVTITRAGGHFQVAVGGTVSIARGEVVLDRSPPSQPLYAAVLLRHALAQEGVVVQGPAGIYAAEDRARVAAIATPSNPLLALGPTGSDVAPSLAGHPLAPVTDLLAVHESEPLPILMRRVNKDSDNEWAERVLETVGAEVLGGAPTTAKGVRVLRDALAELGLPNTAYSPSNGSGLGHQNRVTAAGMTELLRRLYFDPRVGPELMQSLSVGGVDGTTRNRFRGTSAAHRVRAKTGTLNGVSCLSGFVGDSGEVLAFSILVEGHRRRAVSAVRGAQVSAVNAMMRFAQHATTAPPADDAASGTDFESGDEIDEEETSVPDEGTRSEPSHTEGPGSAGPS
jgi:D-alanyl-D-alanine carboxypeptidase/D-alanyl-D-alanine-endopeptidase (penicillin-binding protein 4)